MQSCVTLVVVQLGIFAFRPLVRLGKQSVPHGVVRIVFETDARGRIPLGVLFAESLFSVSPHLQLLPFAQLDDQYLVGFPVFRRVVVPVLRGHGQDPGVARLQVGRRDMSRLIVSALDVKRELHAALLAEVRANAILQKTPKSVCQDSNCLVLTLGY